MPLQASFASSGAKSPVLYAQNAPALLGFSRLLSGAYICGTCSEGSLDIGKAGTAFCETAVGSFSWRACGTLKMTSRALRQF